MDRSLWSQTLSVTSCPAWPCPVCRKGTLALVQKSLVYKETVQSKLDRSDEDWELEWIRYTFTAWAECRHPNCNQNFAIAGKGGAGPMIEDDGDEVWRDYFTPIVCEPMPEMIHIPAKCPNDVKQELRAAFALFWCNRASCAARIRIALECLMNHLDVPKRNRASNGKYKVLNLHARIESFASSQPIVGPQLMALKWLGNTGSHGSRISEDDVLDAFEILEHALGEILEKRSAKVARLAKKLTKRHSR